MTDDDKLPDALKQHWSHVVLGVSANFCGEEFRSNE
jgi:hypothetical protein